MVDDFFFVLKTFGIISGITLLGILSLTQWIKHLSEEEERTTYKSGELVDGTWTCKECGSFNALYLKRCGKCFVPKSDKNEK